MQIHHAIFKIDKSLPAQYCKQLINYIDEKAVTKYYRKASIVVHPDRTTKLDHEKRFIAKRIFDALAQAKAEFDKNGV